MKIQGNLNLLKNIQLNDQTNKNEKSKDSKFGNVLNEFIEQVDMSGKESQKLTQEFVTGGNVEIHEVMIAAEKAKTDLMLLTEIRNKALDTFNELKNM